MARAFVVLNDGETFTDLDGCYILVLSDEEAEACGDASSIKGADYLLKIALRDVI